MREELGMDVSKEPFEYLGRFEAYDPRIDFLMVRHVFVCPTSRRAYDFVDYEGDGAEELSIADAMAAKFPSDVTAPLEAVRKKFFSAAVLAFRKRIEIPNIHKQP